MLSEGSSPPPSSPASICAGGIEADEAEPKSTNHDPDRLRVEFFMRKALDMAELALMSNETPVGCVIIDGDEILARGINATNQSLNGTRHAEIVAIEQVMMQSGPDILPELELFVTVEPCIMCASILRQYGIRKLYFGCFNEHFGGLSSVMDVNSIPGIEPAFPTQGGIFREEAIMLLRRFYVQENEKAPEPKKKKNRKLNTEVPPVKEHSSSASI